MCASVSMCVHMHVCSCVSTHVEARGQPRVSSQRNSPITLDQPATESQGCVCVGVAFPEVRITSPGQHYLYFKNVDSGTWTWLLLHARQMFYGVSHPHRPQHGVHVFKATWLKFHERGSSLAHTSVQRMREESADKRRPQIWLLPFASGGTF